MQLKVINAQTYSSHTFSLKLKINHEIISDFFHGEACHFSAVGDGILGMGAYEMNTVGSVEQFLAVTQLTHVTYDSRIRKIVPECKAQIVMLRYKMSFQSVGSIHNYLRCYEFCTFPLCTFA